MGLHSTLATLCLPDSSTCCVCSYPGVFAPAIPLHRCLVLYLHVVAPSCHLAIGQNVTSRNGFPDHPSTASHSRAWVALLSLQCSSVPDTLSFLPVCLTQHGRQARREQKPSLPFSPWYSQGLGCVVLNHFLGKSLVWAGKGEKPKPDCVGRLGVGSRNRLLRSVVRVETQNQPASRNRPLAQKARLGWDPP